MWSGWSPVSVIQHAETANPPDGRHALLKADEAAIEVCTVAFAFQRAPRIILGFG
jgi:hypothetical protein